MYKDAKDLREVAMKKLDLRLNEIIDNYVLPVLNEAANNGKLTYVFERNKNHNFLQDNDEYEKFQLIFENLDLFKEKLSQHGFHFIDDSFGMSITVSWK